MLFLCRWKPGQNRIPFTRYQYAGRSILKKNQAGKHLGGDILNRLAVDTLGFQANALCCLNKEIGPHTTFIVSKSRHQCFGRPGLSMVRRQEYQAVQ